MQLIIIIFCCILSTTCNNCTIYGPLTHGVTAWGLNINHRRVNVSIRSCNDGIRAIHIFKTIFHNFSNVIYVCFSPKKINCRPNVERNFGKNKNCTIYGPLLHGVSAWALDRNNRQVPGSSTNSNNGKETIKNFKTILNNFEISTICFHPKRINC